MLKLVVLTASCGTGLNVTTLKLEISWVSVTPPVDPTSANASCLGTPAEVSQVVEG